MTVEQKLKELILQRYKSVRAFTTEAGIPYSTIDNIFKRGIMGIGVGTVLKMCATLDIDVDALEDGKLIPKPKLTDSDPHPLVSKYNSLDPHGQQIVDSVLHIEVERMEKIEEEKQRRTHLSVVKSAPAAEEDEYLYLDLVCQGAAAGSGEIVDSDYADAIRVPANDLTRRADYAIRVVGKSMEPKFYDGDIALVKFQDAIDDGEIGIFIIGNERFIKKQGNGKLISLNRKCPSREIGEFEDVHFRGKVIGKLPEERYFARSVARGGQVIETDITENAEELKKLLAEDLKKLEE